jgi:hypothetical protein
MPVLTSPVPPLPPLSILELIATLQELFLAALAEQLPKPNLSRVMFSISSHGQPKNSIPRIFDTVHIWALKVVDTHTRST